MPKTAALKATTAADIIAAFPVPMLADGIYLNLPDDKYHSDPALGSSNIRDLIKGANLYWSKSFMNPKRKKDKKTDSKILGSATHKLLLEGQKEFDRFYVRGPYGDDFDGTSAEKSALTKAAKLKLLSHQELLKADDYDFVMGCKEVLDADPELKGCLDNALTEVSIFWTRPDGVRCKARLDALKVRGIGDIKTIANERERDLEIACKLDISTYRYDIPAAYYSEGRNQMRTLFHAGKVFVGADARPIPFGPELTNEDDLKAVNFLRECCKMTSFGFQLVFIPKAGAPDAWSCVLSPGNPILLAAQADIDTAISYYKMALEKFGTKQRWLPGREVAELAIEEMPYGFGRTNPRR